MLQHLLASVLASQVTLDLSSGSLDLAPLDPQDPGKLWIVERTNVPSDAREIWPVGSDHRLIRAEPDDRVGIPAGALTPELILSTSLRDLELDSEITALVLIDTPAQLIEWELLRRFDAASVQLFGLT
ncbi:MAG: hypothetical protein AB8B96_09920 [Lysobacterales bacterium]